jgi:hypothetical protein
MVFFTLYETNFPMSFSMALGHFHAALRGTDCYLDTRLLRVGRFRARRLG